MRLRKHDGTQERRLVIAMIVDAKLLAALAPRWNPKQGLFASEWANLVGRWCVDYYNNYETAPLAQIQPVFDDWAEHARDEDTVAIVRKFLRSLSDEYDNLEQEINSQYTLDMAQKHFNAVRLQRLQERLEADITGGDYEKAEQRLVDASKDRLRIVAANTSIEVLEDFGALKRAMKTEYQEPLVVLPGALGEFMGQQLSRDSLLAFMGPIKRGKTWWLIHLAWAGMLQRRKVIFFEIGDLSESQIMRRFYTRAVRRPLRPKTVDVPVSMKLVSGKWRIEREEKEYRESVTVREAKEAFLEIKERRVRSDENYLRVSVHPTRTCTVLDIEAELQALAAQGWVADIVVIDYADLLKAISPQLDRRDQIDESWAAMRSLSQKYHNLVITASQSNKASFTATTLNETHFSEDLRKLAHVNAAIALNQDKDEKDADVFRLGWMVLREERGHGRFCATAACLDIGNPAVKSAKCRSRSAIKKDERDDD